MSESLPIEYPDDDSRSIRQLDNDGNSTSGEWDSLNVASNLLVQKTIQSLAQNDDNEGD
jgi:hypothetical protein